MYTQIPKRTIPPALSPYEQGVIDYNSGFGEGHSKPNSNPFAPFTPRWEQYNRGYNKELWKRLGNKK